ncbi:type I glyceraldehyde-3-phosphate dehydrogenase [Alterileibacterium massiliense]|uniref:type I glyceraldehyde-3-phosphate dehydrogenase n=1 Tax=Alterileibacterium massiliense TaxID=1870997 RepID=UPI0008D9A0BC|nr:type I glyceraldehyde-3-phosphate dehydrogenase [Alterileibacterium massiliense]
MIKIGINGFGRISRVVIRAVQDMNDIEIAGINIRNADLDYLAYMIKYDSTFGRFNGTVERWDDKGLIINGKKVPVYSKEVASEIPWNECGVIYVIDGTGAYNTTEKAKAHIDAGAKKVIISAPAKDDITPTFVYGVNHEEYKKDMNIISNASCTTNCLAPLCKILQDNWGIEGGLMATIHSATSKQKTVDARSMKDWRVGRSVFNNIIPTSTGAAKAVGLVIPELKGKMTGISYRVPTQDVSVVDLNVVLSKPAKKEEILEEVKKASESYLKDVVEYVDDEVVSCDFIGDSIASIFDVRQAIQLNDRTFKFVSFYDNEWGYSVQILRMIRHMASVDEK